MTTKLLRLVLAASLTLAVALAGCAGDTDESAGDNLTGDDTDDTDGGLGGTTNDTTDVNGTNDANATNDTNTTSDANTTG